MSSGLRRLINAEIAGSGNSRHVSDLFTAPNGTLIENHELDINTVGWTWKSYSAGSVWTIQGNELANNNATSGFRVLMGNFGVPNVIMSCKLSKIGATLTTNLVVRGVNENNLWQIVFQAGTGAFIYERSSGTPTLRASGTHSLVDGSVVKVICKEQTIQVYIENDLVCQYLSATFQKNATLFGVAKPSNADTAWRWDDFSIVPFNAFSPNPNGSDTFIVAGQSNASGRGATNNYCIQAGLFGNDYHYKTLTDPTDSIVDQVDSISIEPANPPAGSVWPLVAQNIQPITNRIMYFVPCAKGGSSIASWQAGLNHQDRATLYGSMIYRALQIQSQGGNLKAVLWWQGESDTSMTQAEYNSYLDSLANSINSDLGIKLMPCKLQTCTAMNVTVINLAIAEAWGDNANVITGPDLSGLTVDNDDGLGAHLISDSNIAQAATLWSNAIRNAFGW